VIFSICVRFLPRIFYLFLGLFGIILLGLSFGAHLILRSFLVHLVGALDKPYNLVSLIRVKDSYFLEAFKNILDKF